MCSPPLTRLFISLHISLPSWVSMTREYLLSFAFLISLCLNSASAQKEIGTYQGAVEPSTKQEVYGQGVRETQWKTPADEASGFHLPPGFIAELVASEPQINKPLNMAFDHRGRLWVTCTVEYPYPAAEGAKPRDTIKILEDTNGDGSFEKVTLFADELNIPIGLLPVEGGAICFSIPNIWFLKDTDGDDRVDERIKLLGPFDTTRDTHGMVNALRQGSDGWIYACHGFNNRSIVTAADGSKVDMNSGNTFRFLPDGSRIEQFTTGQVNPFGMCSDEWGNWFTADCHSKPITALLAGACYPSFGRPHDGLGFAPSMMDHLHGSTAICGLAYYQADQYPLPYCKLLYSGNVMTSRINCDSIDRNGASLQAREMTDFMTSDDPWFRPVDIQQGPDGCLYIADFYNKIIGHYEVPLTHPDRDRESGRIWRIRYQKEGERPSEKAYSLLDKSNLESSNAATRKLAINAELISKKRSQLDLERIITGDSASIPKRLSALEILTRRQQLTEQILLHVIRMQSPELKVQGLRAICGWESLQRGTIANNSPILAMVSTLIKHGHPEVAKASIEAIGRWGSSKHLRDLLSVAKQSSKDDPVTLQACRIAIRNILQRDEEQLIEFAKRWKSGNAWASSEEAELLAKVLPGVASSSAAQALLEYVSRHNETAENELRSIAIEHASKHPDEKLLVNLLAMIESSTTQDADRRAKLIAQVATTYPPRTKNESIPLRTLAKATLEQLLSRTVAKIESEGPSMQWLDGAGKSWDLEPRKCQDGQAIELLSSLTRNEQYVGQLTSESFACPESLSMWLAGHNGPPDNPDHQLNSVVLIHAKSGQQLKQAFPPRSDVAVEIRWDLKQFSGQEVKIRIVDGDKGVAYAWLGIARPSLPSLQIGTTGKLIQSMASLLKLGFGDPEFVKQAVEAKFSPLQRASIIVAAIEGRGSQLQASLAEQAFSLGRADLVNQQLYDQQLTHEKTVAIAQELCRSATGGQQSSLAQSFLKSQAGCELLADIMQAGWLSPAALRGAPDVLPGTLAADKKEQLKSYFAAAQAAGLDTTAVSKRFSELDWSQANADRGKQLYTQHCAICHQLSGQGAIVGPQLDGAVKRSALRIAEDILLPNLNVDKAFRSTTFLLDDGSIKSGLIRQENDQTIELIGSDAKSVSFSIADVVERRTSEQSLMPGNMGELLNQQQLADLLQFLSQPN
jgi:putative heme-binding domain-containing protein